MTASMRLIIFFLSIFFILQPKASFSEEGQKFKPRISLVLTAGWGSVALNDINKCLGSVNNNKTFEYYREHYPDYIVGEIKKLNTSLYDWDAELRINLTSRFGIGIAASGLFHSGHLKRSNESSLTYTYPGGAGPQVHLYAYKPKIEAWMPPFKVTIYYTLPYSSKIDIFFDLGVGQYEGKMQEFFRLEVTPPDGSTDWITRYWESEYKSSLGFHGGLGIEYSLAKRLDLVAELQLRYAVISNFRGFVRRENSIGGYDESTGFLYYYTMFDLFLGARYADIEVWEKPPDYTVIDIADVRKAKIDLSGFSFRMGIRIGLF